ncbi:MAG TPA: glycosyltransferase family 2 protein [Candidatus Brocadiia bacterium]|nr:glycosyltransferase family 2 protein [Candidatus Brocadiia bacterium]
MIGDIPVSAMIITFNEERMIERALRSLMWADEIVVVDSFSTDKTVEICGKYTDRVYQREFPGYEKQYSYALSLTKHEWVVTLDGDEALTDATIAEIRRELENHDVQCDAFALRRKTFLIDRWIVHSGWYPQYKVRLFKKSSGAYGGSDPHVSFHCSGRVKKLNGDILHWTYPEGLHSLTNTSNKFSTIIANQRLAKGRPFSVAMMLLAPAGEFLKKYFWKRGFLDGMPGLFLAVGSAYYVFCKWAKMWDITHRKTGFEGDPEKQ